MTELETRILDAVAAQPGRRAARIADSLGVDRRLVNSALYGPLKGRVRQGPDYGWYPNVPTRPTTRPLPERTRQQPPNTPLAKLCRYYLDCLSHDDVGGVSEFAASRYGDSNYAEITSLPIIDGAKDGFFDSDHGRRLLNTARRDRNRKAIFLGYPVRLNLVRSRRTDWEGFKVEPILLLPFDEVDSRHGAPSLSDEPPQINLGALRSLLNSGDASLMEEAISLADELGIGNALTDQPDLDELCARLHEIRSEWDWRERIDPYALSTGVPLSRLNEAGIYNRAILVATERSPYTKGLETELGKLQAFDETTYRGTSLGSWLASEKIESPLMDQQPLLEVLPLNSEQRQAVRRALSNPLTVITGPPGTGKSQVVTSILVNAAWQGKTVLFASKNNKAVDVVEARVNALGPRPVLLRLGANAHQANLANYLVSVLAATANQDDHARYQEFKATNAALQQRSMDLDARFQAVIDLRNEVDSLEQRVEATRSALGEKVFARVSQFDRNRLSLEAGSLQAAIDWADRTDQTFLTKLFWPLIRGKRFQRLATTAEAFRDTARDLGLPLPDGAITPHTIGRWVAYDPALATRLKQVLEAKTYFEKLASLTAGQTLEELGRMRRKLTDDLADNSEALWQAWLRLQPTRLTRDQRKRIGDYSALLQLIVSANNSNQKLSGGIFKKYYELFPQITPILPCWAVTSLSARGRVPLDANFFDLLVVDEASQCDIASALPLLFRARRVVVIGDPMQLRHISTLSKYQDQQLLTKHDLLDTHPGWAYSPQSLFDLASGLCRSEDIVALRDHHRSHADIIEFSNETFYDRSLRVATNYDQLRRPDTNGPAVRWIHVPGRTVRPAAGGAINEEEARSVVTELARLANQGYRGSVGVVSPFRAQANRILDLVHQEDGLLSRLGPDFLADTVHKFQGDERDVMVFSPVVSAGAPDTALGFLRSNKNLFNVAVTRARAALIVVGDQATAASCSVEFLAKFANYAKRVGAPPSAPRRDAEHDHGPRYPSVARPDLVSEWERRFYSSLYAAGIRPIPQYPVEKYLLDFAVLSGERRLNIEVDGERYHRNWDGELCRRDQIRNQRLMELGWDVMRFWVYQVRDDLDRCIERVSRWSTGYLLPRVE